MPLLQAVIQIAATKDPQLLSSLQVQVETWVSSQLPLSSSRSASGGAQDALHQGLQGLGVLAELRLPPKLALLQPSVSKGLPER